MNQITPITPIREVPYLTERAKLAYEKYKAVKNERKLLEARVLEMKNAEEELEKVIQTCYPDDDGVRRIPGGIILKRWVVRVEDQIVTPDMIGRVVRKGYQYPMYKEIEG